MLSIMPPVLPILKQPGLMPPTWCTNDYSRGAPVRGVGPVRRAPVSWRVQPRTVAGPMMVTPSSSAFLMMSRVFCSGTPSAMMAVRPTTRTQQQQTQ